MELNKIASAILNDLWGGNLIPLSNRALISLEQIEDEVLEERISIIKDWYNQNKLNKYDLAFSLNCIEVDCKDPNKCPCKSVPGTLIQHFEIPQLMDGIGRDALLYIGSTDRTTSYRVYYNLKAAEYQKYRRRDVHKPYVYIEKTPNENNMYDGWIFNAPFVKYIAVIGIFKDPRQLDIFGCCDSTDYLDLGSISSEIIRRILAKKTQLYRSVPPPATQITS